MKRITVLGRGTAGAISAAYFAKMSPEIELTWVYDPNIPTQAVGEGLNLTPIKVLDYSLDFCHYQLQLLDGTFKTGIFKDGWGETGNSFMHTFRPPIVSYHINALKLQDYIFQQLKEDADCNIKFVEDNVQSNNIDADLVIDCSGRPKSFDDFVIVDEIPVNSVYVTQCFWDNPKFQYSLTNAAKHGWYFGIPLQNRCSIGYLYNNKISTLEEVKEDVQHVFEKYGLTPSDKTNSFSFGNYYRKINYVDNIVYNGNASFFLEPLEATTLGFVCDVLIKANMILNGSATHKQANDYYQRLINENIQMISLHYYSGSKFKSPFWDFAQEKSEKYIKQCLYPPNKDTKNKFRDILEISLNINSTKESKNIAYNSNFGHGSWSIDSYYQNIEGLGIREKLLRYFS